LERVSGGHSLKAMLLSLFLTCVVSLGINTLLLLTLGHRLRFSSRLVGLLLALITTIAAGEIAAAAWRLRPGHVEAAEVVLFVFSVVVIALRGVWNPIGQVFFGSLLASVLTYLAFAGLITFGGGLSWIGELASTLLLILEIFALTLGVWFSFETLDVVTRTRPTRRITSPDPNHLPKVSLHIAAYNEPPDMLIETIKSIEALDYPDFEIVIIDNNTKERETWQPVYDYCRERPRVKFVHVDDWPGYKSGALNLVLREYVDPKAEIIGVIDADYLLDPAYLRSVVGYFVDPKVAFVQTPQDYREYEGNTYLTACYDAYKYFFTATMPARNQRNSIIFAGTMGLLRRSALEELGGWDEWCITEDAETSLRLLKLGYSGVYIQQSYGRGIMPLSFAAFKSQRFRWCFGGIQILRKHWRSLLPWRRTSANRLTTPQRLDYLFGSLQWFNDLLYLGFTAVLLATTAVILTRGRFGLRPLIGVAVLLPAVLIASGLLRAVWALRLRTGIGTKRAVLAFLNWLSVSWTVAIACLQGLFRSEGVFMRTPKTSERRSLFSAFWSARVETVLAGLLWGGAAAVGFRGEGSTFLIGLLAWQGTVYGSALLMSWLNQRSALPPDLERRRVSEWMRERLGGRLAYVVGATGSLVALAVLAIAMFFGGSNPGRPVQHPFAVAHSSAGEGPITRLVTGTLASPEPTPTPSETPSPTATESPSPTPSPTESPTTSPTPSPTPTTPSPSPS
jgi:cellulose synthase/poly-beta-1,6-N-acetylglucosamine synthase-like glycosyltransferase